jgi:hypothetical protein
MCLCVISYKNGEYKSGPICEHTNARLVCSGCGDFLNYGCWANLECVRFVVMNHETHKSCPKCEHTHAGLACSRF